MIKTIKMIKKIVTNFFPYKLSKEEKLFIKNNEKHWSKNNYEVGILIEGFVDSPTSIIEKARIAKAAETVLKKDSIVITRSFYSKSSNVREIYESFSINKTINWWRGYVNPILLVTALFGTIKLFLKVSNGDDLVKYKIKNILVGDLIYDTLIRFIPNSYTVGKLRCTAHFRLIFRAIFSFLQNEKILNRYDIEAVVTSHNVYAEYGLLCRQAHKKGALILLKDIDYFKCYDKNMNVNEHFLKISTELYEESLNSNDVIKKAEEYFENRLSGNINQIDIKNAFENKIIYQINELVEPNKVNNKNVFVMAHAFSDAPHVGEYLLFRDYYDWLVKTLIHLNSSTDINCFVKSHPSSYMWGEKGVVESIIEKYKLKNIYILSKDTHPKTIYNLADCIVTAKGTAGLEFSCNGIPAIIAGQSCYSGFSVAIESKTVEEYYSNLDSIKTLSKLNDNVKLKSKVLLYKTFTNIHHSDILPEQQIQPGDDYKLLFRKKFDEVNCNFAKGIEIKDDFYKLVIDNVRMNK